MGKVNYLLVDMSVLPQIRCKLYTLISGYAVTNCSYIFRDG